MSFSNAEIMSAEFLEYPMISEFRVWIVNDIKWRLTTMGYSEMSDDFERGLQKFLSGKTNEDYICCTDNLTSNLEEFLVSHGIKRNDAIRLSWKWSD